jgi:hypothetical protein
MNTSCIDCGEEYEYNPSKPLGASSARCSRCRKRDSILNKKIILFNIAGNGNLQCRKCGYKDCVSALTLLDGKSFLGDPKTQDEKEVRAKSQFILCLNCDAEIKQCLFEFKVIDSSCYPIEVEFYSLKVTIVKEKITPKVSYTHDAREAEIVGDSPEGISNAKARVKRISPGELSTVQIDV